MTASELTELAARVEAGSGSEPGLEAEIAMRLGWMRSDFDDRDGVRQTLWARPGNYDEDDFSNIGKSLPPWTSSLDAVLALVEERLPGWAWNLDVEGNFCNAMAERIAKPHDRQHTVASSPALALLAICLRALAAQQQDRPIEGE